MNLIKFKVTKWSVRPEVIEYPRETAHYYVRPSGGRDAKVSRYYVYFDTEAEALQHIAERQQVEQAAKRLKQIEAAAPDLLAACQAARALWGDYLPPGNSKAMEAMRLVDEAISRATGGEL